ncbi:MAG: sulfur oxidation c-type cytochrome SoxA [Betaproteobacteria bacterium]|nr:MAG: sulfur oxidation c-type cytochrome SoxA [Betaproteobacteria bacterium]
MSPIACHASRFKRAFLTLLLLLVGAPLFASPEEDREAFLAFFSGRFPGVPLEQYVHGSMMLSEDALSQYESIMDFPPFQGDIDRGRMLWEKPFANGRTFADCFDDGGRNVAGLYPYYDEANDRVVTFEMALNACLKENGEAKLDYGDRSTMGVLTAYARTLSDGMAMNIKVDSEGARKKYEAGRAFYFRRIGQHNLACASCHYTHAGHYFRDELLSPTIGQAVHFPVFRGGEFLFTLHMRYQRCMEALRAVPFAAGSEELNNLEYFHSYLNNGLPLKASVYRR